MATGDSYYDILLIGRTGKGKSTTGNKLLKIVANEEEPIPTTAEEDAIVPQFVSKPGADSCTQHCKALAAKVSSTSEACRVRVLDTPGFADTRKQGVNVYEANLGIIRAIIRNQHDRQMKFSRVLYFLPQRGPLERSDATFQEEIKIMHGYFGTEIFDVMVVIATNHFIHQACGFSKVAIEGTEDTFIKTFEKTIGKKLPKCPPILYLPIDEKDVLGKVKSAEVLNDTPLLALTFNERCAKCANKLVYVDAENEKLLVRVVINEGGPNEEEVAVNATVCHPCFIPKHSTLKKVTGGFAHVLTLGVPLLLEKFTDIETWPGFTNTDEICASCLQPPGSKGCKKTKSVYTLQPSKQRIETCHSTEMLKYKTYT